ncbi:MAG TPA: FAD-binding oxidoreductase [Longimicrobiaceae bacterium]|nr:FAD-binding oxidoreductase [Longimicrobiaceae bacterium]
MNLLQDTLARQRRDYSDVSYWLDELGEIEPRPSVEGDAEFDVAIIGGGLSGLWTAYYLLRKSPGIRVAVLEAQVCGFGAAGRNGGWCNATALGLSPAGMVRKWGRESARQTILTLRQTLDEIREVTVREGLDVGLVRQGVLRVAHGDAEVPSIDRSMAVIERLGLIDGHKRLSEHEAREWINMAGVKGGLYDPFVEWVHPALLVRGLANAVERLGGTIHEHSFVTGWQRGTTHQLVTAQGRVKAERVILATEAYSIQFSGYRRRLAPMYSFITITEPLSDQQLEAIGWTERFTLSSQSLTVDYISRTSDGRIAVGGRGAPYKYASRISDAQDRDRVCHERLQTMFGDYFPQLHGIRFTHSWGGVLGVPRDWIPNVWYDPADRVGGAMGFTGQGQLVSNLSGRIISDLIVGLNSRESHLPFVDHHSRNWEPEPFRWLGVRAVQHGLNRIQSHAELTGRAPSGRSLAERLSRH